MESQNCQYNHKGVACPLAGSTKMTHHNGWYCYIHAKKVPEGKEEIVLSWIKLNRQQIEKAWKNPYLFELPCLPDNYYPSRPAKQAIEADDPGHPF